MDVIWKNFQVFVVVLNIVGHSDDGGEDGDDGDGDDDIWIGAHVVEAKTLKLCHFVTTLAELPNSLLHPQSPDAIFGHSSLILLSLSLSFCQNFGRST